MSRSSRFFIVWTPEIFDVMLVYLMNFYRHPVLYNRMLWRRNCFGAWEHFGGGLTGFQGAEQVCHLDCGDACAVAVVALLPARTIDGLLQCVGGQNAKYDGYAR